MASQDVVFEPQAMTRKRSWPKVVVVILLLAVLAAGGVGVYLHFLDRVSSDDAEVDGHITAVAPKISGNVTEVLVDDNQAVKAGQVLVRIDARDYQARVDQERAALAEAESRLRAARAGVPLSSETTESGTSMSSAELANTQAELERARMGYEQASGSELAYRQANVEAKEANN
jgi:membrane fusion protein, multidrug efflux system